MKPPRLTGIPVRLCHSLPSCTQVYTHSDYFPSAEFVHMLTTHLVTCGCVPVHRFTPQRNNMAAPRPSEEETKLPLEIPRELNVVNRLDGKKKETRSQRQWGHTSHQPTTTAASSLCSPSPHCFCVSLQRLSKSNTVTAITQLLCWTDNRLPFWFTLNIVKCTKRHDVFTLNRNLLEICVT